MAGVVIESELRNGEPLGRIDKYLIAALGVLVLVLLKIKFKYQKKTWVYIVKLEKK